ncbi:hypothetical protein [Poseidonibacter ostreae]|uniref:Penicillin-binding protein activator n=1 Tax=Poseidonibacter ostreae TaxID=2654171 RepID=A0A6L4WSN6_9BACT|nr:hypothetical protein [Poseidonibacter ostreae]KAB7885104.1 hypothetical protein GA417_09305 [Poseidonibacter ostreae]KAB7888810.1 hypothetical protein GBG19_07940 [Poseidonibacter ostreae]KAB7891207.1 hypothetical protein GBG18_07250 [Poseidonibacter ostreae]
MKYLLSFLLITFFFVGCSTKQEVEIKLPDKTDIGTPIEKEEVIKPIEEEIEPIIEDPIIEDEMPIIDNSEIMKLAVIYPSKIVAKYAKSSINTVLGYFDYKKIKYELKVFDTLSEDEQSIQKAFYDAKEAGFTNVIALFTPRVTEFLHSADTSDLKVYLPLTNKQNLVSHNNNFIYGAISYKDQVNKLFEYSNTNNTMFYEKSFLTNKIKTIYDTTFFDIKVVKEIKKKRNYFKGIVKDYRIKNSTLFLNTSIVKTSILLSQLRAYNIYPKVILSTQINYNPKVLTLTQEKDRSNLVLASSIDSVDDTLRDTVLSYGSDILYNWVDYSTLVGVNYLYDQNISGLITTRVEDNQVMYEPKLLKTTAYGFLEIK